MAQGGHLRHRNNHDSYLVVQRTHNSALLKDCA
jgi:hypothetical protein